MYKKIVTFLTFFLFCLPLLASAQINNFPCPQGLYCPASGTTGNGVALVNSLITTLINYLLAIAFGLAVLFLIIGGLRYIVSSGNEESAEAAKSTVVNAIIGIVLVILSYVIINIVANLLANSVTAPGP